MINDLRSPIYCILLVYVMLKVNDIECGKVDG